MCKRHRMIVARTDRRATHHEQTFHSYRKHPFLDDLQLYLVCRFYGYTHNSHPQPLALGLRSRPAIRRTA